MEPLRSFTLQGIQAFRSYLEELRAGSKAPPDQALLRHSAWTKQAPGRMQFSPTDAFLQDPGLWAWLSLAHFDSVCPLQENGTRTPGMDYRHIPGNDQRSQHRHLLKGPYDVYTRYGEAAAHLLQGQVYRESALYHEIVGRQDLIANPTVVTLTRSLYFDESNQSLKSKAADSKAAPGSIRRLVAVLMQLDLTYDLHGMSEADLFSLLPQREFGPWMESKRRLETADQTSLPIPKNIVPMPVHEQLHVGSDNGPHDTEGEPRFTITEKILMTFKGREGQTFSRAEVVDMVLQAFKGTNRTSVLPSDYCYNIVNKGIPFKNHFFEYHERGRYTFLGRGYPYQGPIRWKGEEVGRWVKGKDGPEFFHDF